MHKADRTAVASLLCMSTRERRVTILGEYGELHAEDERVPIDPNDPRPFMTDHSEEEHEGSRRRQMTTQGFRFATVNQLRTVMIVQIVTLVLLLGIIGVAIWIGVGVVGPMMADASSTLTQASTLAHDPRIPIFLERFDSLSASAVQGMDFVQGSVGGFSGASASDWRSKLAAITGIIGVVQNSLSGATGMLEQAGQLGADAMETMRYVKGTRLLENSVLLVTTSADLLRLNMPLIRSANATKAAAMATDLADALQDLINTFRQTGVNIKLKK
jgi:hypothetical protein